MFQLQILIVFCTLTFRYPTKFYANNQRKWFSSNTMTAIGGLSNISVNASATFVVSLSTSYSITVSATVTTSVASILVK